MGLRYAVLTAVARDDLADGGAAGFAASIEAIRRPHARRARRGAHPRLQGRPRRPRDDLRRPARRAEPQHRDRAAAAAGRAPERVVRPEPRRARPGQGCGPHDQVRPHRRHGRDATTRWWPPSPTCERWASTSSRSASTCGPTTHHLPSRGGGRRTSSPGSRRVGEAMGIGHVESSPLTRSSYHAAQAADVADLGQKPGSSAGSTSVRGEIVRLRSRPSSPRCPGGVRRMSRLRSRFAAAVATLVAVVLPDLSDAGRRPDDAARPTAPRPTPPRSTCRCSARASRSGWRTPTIASDPKARRTRASARSLPGSATSVDRRDVRRDGDGDRKGTANPPACGPITLPPGFPVVVARHGVRRRPSRDRATSSRPRRPTRTVAIDRRQREPGARPARRCRSTRRSASCSTGSSRCSMRSKDNADIDAQIAGRPDHRGDHPGRRPRAHHARPVARRTSRPTADADTARQRSPRARSSRSCLVTCSARPGRHDRGRRVVEHDHVDRSTGAATVHFEPALVKVTFADDIATALSLQAQNPISIAPGQSQCLGLPAPLDSCITVAGGTQGKTDEGGTHAEAAAREPAPADGMCRTACARSGQHSRRRVRRGRSRHRTGTAGHRPPRPTSPARAARSTPLLAGHAVRAWRSPAWRSPAALAATSFVR